MLTLGFKANDGELWLSRGAQNPASLVLDYFAKHPLLVKGYIGPEVLGEESKSGIRFVVDPRISEGTRWVTGANVHGQHAIELLARRNNELFANQSGASICASPPSVSAHTGTAGAVVVTAISSPRMSGSSRTGFDASGLALFEALLPGPLPDGVR